MILWLYVHNLKHKIFSMLSKNYLIILIISSLIIHVSASCGCNANRQGTLKTTDFQSFFRQDNILYLKDTCSKYSDSKFSNMSLIPAGTYEIGTKKQYFIADKEFSIRNVTLRSFYIDKYEVTNRQFFEFVKATDYITEAEIYKDSFVFMAFLTKEQRKLYENFRVVGAPWWYKVDFANWFKPEGNNSNLNDRWDHPVVHVSWNDAITYCSWRNGRLPTEWEWEVACKGNKQNKLYPWGNKLVSKGLHRMNIWQGTFPTKNTLEDGWIGTSPVGSFLPNSNDIYDITGNVWEWTNDVWDSNNLKSNERVKKGGSYLCHASYCNRYRCSARSQNTVDSTAGNLGFRCCLDP